METNKDNQFFWIIGILKELNIDGLLTLIKVIPAGSKFANKLTNEEIENLIGSLFEVKK